MVQRAASDIEGLDLSWTYDGLSRSGDDGLRAPWPSEVTPGWAFGDGGGAGTRVAVIDSGVEPGHPLVGSFESYAAEQDGESVNVIADAGHDMCGHGTACAGIIRALAPGCEIVSVRVLGMGFFGSGEALIAGLRWAIDNGCDVINLSLSTTKRETSEVLYRLADLAYFRRTLIVASAHNTPVASFPWRFSSVISVGSHRMTDPELFYYNPRPPVEFFARGEDVSVAWLRGGTTTCTGNSFATPHIAGMCARILGAHPGLTPFQVKTILHLTAANVRREDS
jgi:subtilisin family serine protease